MSATRTARRTGVLLPVTLWAAALALPAATPAAATEQSAGAVVFSVTESVRPGEVLGVQGTRFSLSPDLRFTRVSGSETTVVPDQPLRVLAHSPTIVHGVVPTGTPHGLFAVTADGSRVEWVNRARAVNYEFPTVAPGTTFRVFGRNLVLGSAGTPTVAFRHPASGAVTAATVDTTRSDQFQLTATAPATLAPGTSYQVVVSNGYGGRYGESTAPRPLPVVADAGDPFTIGAPWGGDFSAIAGRVVDVTRDVTPPAAGDGQANDRAAIQTAINAAAAAGGGTVYLPAGTYKVDAQDADALMLKSGVVIRGAGREQTTVTESASGGTSVFGMPANPTRIGLVDLSVRNTSKPWISHFLGTPDNKASRLFIVRSSLVSSASPGVLHWASYYDHVSGAPPCARTDRVCNDRLIVRDSELVSTDTRGGCCIVRADQWRQATWADNVVRYNWSRFMIGDGRDLLFERNHITRTRATSDVAAGQYGGPWFEQPSTSMVRGNLLDREGPAYPFNNDGESLGFEGYLHMGAAAKRSVKTATATTVTQDNGAFPSWPTGCCDNMSLILVTGAGAGQVRTVVGTTPETLTVDRPFDVVPQPGDRMLVRDSSDDLSVVENTITDAPNGIMFYDAPTRDLAVVGNTMRDAEGINLWEFERGFNAYPQGFKDDFSFNVNALIADNSVTRTTSTSPAFISIKMEDIADDVSRVYGTSSYLAQVRRNTVAATMPDLDAQGGRHGTKVEGIWVYAPNAYEQDAPAPDPTTRILSGPILDGNTVRDVSNAYTMGTGVYDATIWNSTTSGVTRLLRDDVASTVGRGAVGTIGPDGHPLTLPPRDTYSASSVNNEDLGNTSNGPERAFDGTPHTYWWSQGPTTTALTPEWLEVRFRERREIAEVHVDGGWFGSPTNNVVNNDLTIAVADDGGELRTIATVTGNTARDVPVVLERPVGADRLRVTITRASYAGIPYPAAVGELRVVSPPSVGATTAAPAEPTEGEPVVLSSPVRTTSSEVTCAIDPGDGSGALEAGVQQGRCTGPGHAYADDGTYTVTTTVTEAGRTTSGTSTVVVANSSPRVAEPAVASRSRTGRTVTVAAAFTDAGRADGPFSCTVDFGDGTAPAAGALDAGRCTATHSFARRGSYLVSVEVTDKDSGTGRATTPVVAG